MQFSKNARLAKPTVFENKLSRLSHRRITGRSTSNDQGEFGFDRCAQFSTVAIVEFPATVRSLLLQNVSCHLPNLPLAIFTVIEFTASIGMNEDPVEHDILCSQRDIGLQFRPPISFMVLLFEEVILRSNNRLR